MHSRRRTGLFAVLLSIMLLISMVPMSAAAGEPDPADGKGQTVTNVEETNKSEDKSASENDEKQDDDKKEDGKKEDEKKEETDSQGSGQVENDSSQETDKSGEDSEKETKPEDIKSGGDSGKDTKPEDHNTSKDNENAGQSSSKDTTQEENDDSKGSGQEKKTESPDGNKQDQSNPTEENGKDKTETTEGNVQDQPGSSDETVQEPAGKGLKATPPLKADNPEGNTYKVTVDGDDTHGTVTANITSDEFVKEGEEIILTIYPEEGYDVYNLQYQFKPSDNPDAFGQIAYPTKNNDGTYSFKMPAADVTVTFAFRAKHTVTLDLGKGHGELAKAFENDSAYTVSGTRVTMPVLADSKGDLYEYIGRVLGEKFRDLINSNDLRHNGEKLFRDGYWFGLEPLQKYSNQNKYDEEYLDEDKGFKDVIDSDKELYLLWTKPVQNIQVTIQVPKCGTEIKFVRDYYTYSVTAEYSDPSPEMSMKGDAGFWTDYYHGLKEGVWVDNDQGVLSYDDNGRGYFQGKIEGDKTYWVSFDVNSMFGFFFDETTKDAIKINGSAPVHVDGTRVTAGVTAVHVMPEEGVSAKPATCEKPGTRTYTCEGCGEKFENEEDPDHPALGHDWENPTYTWSEDNSTVTAKRVCKRDASHVEEETVGASSKKTKEAGCETKGETTCTSKEFNNKAFKVQKKTVETGPLGHDWSDPTYTWSDDNSTVTAKRVCSRDASHVEKETVETSSEVTKKAGCETKGETTYTSKEFKNKAFKVQKKTVETGPLGHDWNAPTYTWSDDNSEVTAKRVCRHDPSHIEQETVKTKIEIINGKKTYTADFKNSAFKDASKSADENGVSYRFTQSGGTWTKGSGKTLAFTINRSKEDDQTLKRFKGIKVDNKTVPENNYTIEAGSVILNLKPAYLENLSVDSHTLTAEFDDGSAQTSFNIAAAKKNGTSSTTKRSGSSSSGSPRTGDENNIGLWVVMALAAAAALAGIVVFRRKNRGE
ncbi:MAG: LPXTG cell wall anchor domain-containing protein [Eubacteriales bacterium]|nr:LPXTG cell wall anchor domain-containing protein [Eubacteriales bacterium]